jgi:uncharacterized protein YozE (UPF0346 family)
MKTMDFITWLKNQYKRNDLVGDLARDTRADSDMPAECKTYKQFKEYLEDICVCDGAFEALKRAHEEYNKYLQNRKEKEL